jgi:1-phosphofructokinase family hexose kinase
VRLLRVVTVTPNAAVDRTLVVASLRPGARHRVLFSHEQAGGKGVNVSRVLRALGCEVATLVVVGGEDGAWIVRDLETAGLRPIAVPAAGRSRTCLEIVDDGTGEATQIHGDGVAADPSTGHRLEALLKDALQGADWLALCGSLASGFSDDCYARWIRLAQRRGVRVALDASGAALATGWGASPDLLRINREEAAAALGVASSAVELPPPRAPGAPRWTVVSDGQRPIFAWSAGVATVYRVEPPRVRTRNAIGAGDAMLAGLLARAAGPFESALAFGAALGAADAESRTAGRPDVARAAELAADVTVVRTQAAAR